jgi:hypothetical protein
MVETVVQVVASHIPAENIKKKIPKSKTKSRISTGCTYSAAPLDQHEISVQGEVVLGIMQHVKCGN